MAYAYVTMQARHPHNLPHQHGIKIIYIILNYNIFKINLEKFRKIKKIPKN